MTGQRIDPVRYATHLQEPKGDDVAPDPPFEEKAQEVSGPKAEEGHEPMEGRVRGDQ